MNIKIHKQSHEISYKYHHIMQEYVYIIERIGCVENSNNQDKSQSIGHTNILDIPVVFGYGISK